MNEPFWARLCRRCGTIDATSATESREDARQNIDWTCSRCGGTDTWQLVRVERMPEQAAAAG